MYPKSEPKPYVFLLISGYWVLLTEQGVDEPGVEIALVYETTCDPSTCLQLADDTLHLGYLEAKEAVWSEQPPWRPMNHAATHRFRVVTPDIYDFPADTWEEHQRKPKRFR